MTRPEERLGHLVERERGVITIDAKFLHYKEY